MMGWLSLVLLLAGCLGWLICNGSDATATLFTLLKTLAFCGMAAASVAVSFRLALDRRGSCAAALRGCVGAALALGTLFFGAMPLLGAS
jgi:hypothetical protein